MPILQENKLKTNNCQEAVENGGSNGQVKHDDSTEDLEEEADVVVESEEWGKGREQYSQWFCFWCKHMFV